jgi:NAD(P) transhydrogenase subunit beta
MGFVLDNKLLITAGALDGSSGLILSVIMCRAMNRSFTNVLFGAFGQVQAAKGDAEAKEYKSETIEGAAQILEQASLVVIVPGYGMAVAQAQHKVKELYENLAARHHREVRDPSHVAACPGMNVLLAGRTPAGLVRWTDQFQMPQCDVCLVVGGGGDQPAAARQVHAIYGMPIINADRRGGSSPSSAAEPRLAGIDNSSTSGQDVLALRRRQGGGGRAGRRLAGGSRAAA